MIDKVDKFRRPKLFSIPVKNTQNLYFKLQKSAISAKTNSSGKF